MKRNLESDQFYHLLQKALKESALIACDGLLYSMDVHTHTLATHTQRLAIGGSNPKVTGRRWQVSQFAGTTKNISPTYKLSVVIKRFLQEHVQSITCIWEANLLTKRSLAKVREIVSQNYCDHCGLVIFILSPLPPLREEYSPTTPIRACSA